MYPNTGTTGPGTPVKWCAVPRSTSHGKFTEMGNVGKVLILSFRIGSECAFLYKLKSSEKNRLGLGS